MILSSLRVFRDFLLIDKWKSDEFSEIKYETSDIKAAHDGHCVFG